MTQLYQQDKDQDECKINQDQDQDQDKGVQDKPTHGGRWRWT